MREVVPLLPEIANVMAKSHQKEKEFLNVQNVLTVQAIVNAHKQYYSYKFLTCKLALDYLLRVLVSCCGFLWPMIDHLPL